ncbi:MAG: IS3 family transposase [Blastocatellia bacterium]|jgi:hypothetical protein
MRFLFIRVEKANYPLTVLCRVLKASRSGDCAFEKRSPSKCESLDRELTVQTQEVHQKSRQTYGSPRIHRELREGRRQQVGRQRVARLMQSAGLKELEIRPLAVYLRSREPGGVMATAKTAARPRGARSMPGAR